jgi:formyl-CoA transferase
MMNDKTSKQTGPLSGLKVIELGQLIAGPFATRIMAEFGAEVIKIEPPADEHHQGGDPLRTWRKLHKGQSLWWSVQARNKKSVTLNLKDERAQAIVRDLVKEADVIVENFRPGALEKWGLGYDTLKAINPRLVMVRISGFGQDGPYRDKLGFGAIGESMGGMRYITGYPDRAPVRVGISIGDSLTGLYAVIGALMALRHRDASGEGQVIDAALYESVFSMMESMLPEYSQGGFVRERTGASLPGIVPSNTYPCGDGAYVVIGANGDSIFKRMMVAIGRDDLATDAALANNAGRTIHTERIDQAIEAWTRSLSLEEVLRVLDAAQVPAARIYSIADIANDAHYQARGMIERHALDGGEGGNSDETVLLPGIVPKLSATPGATRWVGPKLGQHTDEVLKGLGLDEAMIQKLRSAGVV